MKIFIFRLLTGIVDILKKTTKSGEKKQEIEEKKLTEFKTYIAYITLILLIICILGGLFPKLYVSPWFYSMFEKGWNYVLQGGI
ncbi:hypothetical protein [Fusobacterium ulcerans]|uniref:hypothetical protein n=1 Tax=Fusobacterium ulcerans TaxID=861 RepID=UPI0027BB0DC4|nr:hypothetical protein [Fusobacterium ulcerans]